MNACYGERLIVSAGSPCRVAVASCCKWQLERQNVGAMWQQSGAIDLWFPTILSLASAHLSYRGELVARLGLNRATKDGWGKLGQPDGELS